ncbi:MAG: Ldh family oxidoreductase [Spirochaetales bacterium]|jgi:ureidoglycolate dehydrogenase (NAD+)|nr:Ldh family oxidoreductase [Spirochaetales bacterium]
MADDIVVVKAPVLKKMAVKKLTEASMTAEDAGTVADILIFADLRGVHSHGVLRVEHYAKRIRSGGINLKMKLKAKMLKPTVGLLDAQGGMGHIAAKYAMGEAIKIAGKKGMALMGVKNASHCGALAYYARMAIDAKMAGMVCVNTDKCMVPFGGSKSFFGTNPFAFGFPGKKDSILLDMATSEVAFGKILHAREKNIKIPDNWGVDAGGNKCSDPHKVVSVVPFGGPKGYGVAVMVEALTGLMIGGVFGPHLMEMYGSYEKRRNLSNFFFVIDPSVFGAQPSFLATTQKMIDELHAQPTAPGTEKVLIPGEIEYRNMERYKKEGIPVPRSVYDFLSK